MDREPKKSPVDSGRQRPKKDVPGPEDAHTFFMIPEPTPSNDVITPPHLDHGLSVQVGNRWIEVSAGRYAEQVRLELTGSDIGRLVSLLFFVLKSGAIADALASPKGEI